MILWLDAQLSPRLASWISAEFGVAAYAARDLGLRDAPDREIFDAARAAGSVIVTKDRDFVDLLSRFGPPPKILWITSGNTSVAHLQEVLERTLPSALALLEGTEGLVEIRDVLRR